MSGASGGVPSWRHRLLAAGVAAYRWRAETRRRLRNASNQPRRANIAAQIDDVNVAHRALGNIAAANSKEMARKSHRAATSKRRMRQTNHRASRKHKRRGASGGKTSKCAGVANVAAARPRRQSRRGMALIWHKHIKQAAQHLARAGGAAANKNPALAQPAVGLYRRSARRGSARHQRRAVGALMQKSARLQRLAHQRSFAKHRHRVRRIARGKHLAAAASRKRSATCWHRASNRHRARYQHQGVAWQTSKWRRNG